VPLWTINLHLYNSMTYQISKSQGGAFGCKQMYTAQVERPASYT